MKYKNNNVRNYGIDLLRIVSMFMIVIMHIIQNNETLKLSIIEINLKNECVYLLEIFALVAVNCYALISGYVMHDKKVKYSKIIYLLFETIFYSFIITLIFMLINKNVTIVALIKSIFPVTMSGLGNYWYITAYFGLILFVPLLNYVINNLDKRTLFISLFIIICVCSISPFVLMYDPFVIRGGYSVIWLMILYLIGGIIHKYPMQIKVHKCFIIYFISSVLTWVIKVIVQLIFKDFYAIASNGNLYMNYVSITTVVASIALLLLFSNLKINSKKIIKLIKAISPLTLGVYLIHNHIDFAHNILGGLNVIFENKPIFTIMFLIIVMAFIIFIFCMILEKIRMIVFEVFRISKLSICIVNQIKKILLHLYSIVENKVDWI